MGTRGIETLLRAFAVCGMAALLAQCGTTAAERVSESPPAESAPALALVSSPPAGDGVVTAALLRSRTGGPLAGSLTVTGPGGLVRTAAARADGFVRVDGLPLGVPLNAVATSPGLLPVPLCGIRLDSDLPFDFWSLPLGEAISIEVRVWDEKSRALPGVTLELLPRSIRSGSPVHSPPLASGTTDHRGRAVLSGVPPGNWRVQAKSRGRGTWCHDVELVEGALHRPVEISLGPGHALEGRILDFEGRPVAGRDVVVLLGGRFGWPSFSATDREGRFRFEDLPETRVHVAVPDPAGFLEEIQPLEPIRLPAPGPVELRMPARGEIRGRVLDDATGLPVPGARVVVRCSTWIEQADPVESGADGGFVVRHVPSGSDARPGTHGCPVDLIGVTRTGYLSAWLPRRGTWLDTPCVVPTGAPSTEGASLEVRLRKGTVVVHGVVRTRDGTPVPGAWVTLGLGDPRGEWSTFDTTSDAEGRYRLPPVPTGNALLMAGARMLHLEGMGRGAYEVPPHSDRRMVLPDSGEVERDLVLVPDSAVEGRMVLADGRPAAGYVPVIVHAHGGTSTGDSGAPIGEDGTFRIEELNTEEGIAIAANGPRGRMGISEKFDLAESARVTGVVVRVVLPASVSGRVVGPDGRPVAGAWVRLEGEEAARVPWDTSIDAHPDGSFEFEARDAGRWTAIAGAPGLLHSGAMLLDLAEGENRAGVVLTLRPGESISGRTLDAAGAPVSGATVGAFRIPDPEPWSPSVLIKPGGVYADGSSGADQVTESGSDGAFRISGLETKTYFVAALKEGLLGSVASARAGSSGLVLLMRGPAVVSGVVEDPDGVAVEGASVSVVAPEWSVEEGRRPQAFGSARFDWLVDMEDSVGREVSEDPARLFGPKVVPSGPGGTFRIDCPEGECRFVASAEGFIHGEAIVRAPAEGVRIRLRPSMSVAGRVVGPDGAHVADAQVWARAVDEEAFEEWATSREDGSFVVTGLPPGSYGLRAEAREANLVQAGREVVAEAGAKGVEVPTREGFRFRARLVRPDGSAPSEDDHGVVVEVIADGERGLDQRGRLEGGHFELRGLGKCTLRLHVLRDGQSFDLARPLPGTVFGPFEVPGPEQVITLGK